MITVSVEVRGGREYVVRHKLGEVTATPLYQVQGDPHWAGSVDEAIRRHIKLSRYHRGNKENSPKQKG